MGLFRPERRANPFENPSISLSDASLLTIFGGEPTVAGVQVNEPGAVSTSIAVYRAISLLAGLVAGLPLNAFRIRDKTRVAVSALTDHEEAPYTQYELWELVMTHLLGWGNSYCEKIRDGAGRVDSLRPINPDRVKPRLMPPGDGMPALKVFEVTVTDGQPPVPYTNYEIMHIPGLGYDGLLGLSPIGVARQAIGISRAADDLAGRLYANGNLMSGILTTDKTLTQDQADALKSRWREKMQGAKHAHDVAVLDTGTKFQTLTISPEDAQFLESRRWQTIEIARLYGIPPHLLGDVEKSTSWGTGIEQQNIGLVTYSVRPWLHRIEQRVSREIVSPSTQVARFDVNALLRGDAAARAAYYTQGIQWGWLTRNEARAGEEMQPIDGLDEPLTPLNMKAGTSDVDGVLEPENDVATGVNLTAVPNDSAA